MKKLSIAILIIPFLFACGNTEITEDNYTDLIDMENPPVITFEETEYDFGTVIEGAQVQKMFHFTNTGKGPLVISSVTASCGCTVPKNWPRTPIKPGEKAYVEVIFDSEGRAGTANKTLTVVANTQPTDTYLKLKGTVVGPIQE